MLSRSSSTTNLRRSSILKPPKSRQPFQDLDFNASSPENSPESTKKRRVSFAEKKHVKEFCDHKEQGTIWDNTYEEADQNISKSPENIEGNNFPLENCENVNMDSNGVENSPTKIFSNSLADIELTEVIHRSRRNTNSDPMSRTLFCEDADLDTTEAIGGIEPTVSMKKVVDFQSPPRMVDKIFRNPNKTVIFDDSDSDMKLTQVVSGRITGNPMPVIVKTDTKIEKMNSFAEDRTIIFEDSVMDLTLPESNLVPGSGFFKSSGIKESGNFGDAGKMIDDNLGRDCYQDEFRATQAADKTIIFNDLGCEMTKPIVSVIHRVPKVDSGKSDDATEARKYEIFNSDVMKNRTDFSSRISEKSNCRHDLESSNKTIFFNDVEFEITKAIDRLRPNKNCRESVETSDSEQTARLKKLELISTKDKLTEPETSGLKISSVVCESDEIECSENFQTGNSKNRIKLFDESGIEFTTAITSAKNLSFEENPSLPPGDFDSTVGVAEKSLEPNSEKCNEHSSSNMSFTKILSTDVPVTDKERLSKSSGDIGIEQCRDSSIDENFECEIDLTEAVRPADLRTRYSDENLKEQDGCSNFIEFSAGAHSSKKRKSTESIEDIEANKESYSLMKKNLNSEYELSLLQSSPYNKTINLSNENLMSESLAPGCERLKVSDFDASINCELPEITSSNLASISRRKSCQVEEAQMPISADVSIASDRLSNFSDEYDICSGEKSPICSPNPFENRDQSPIDDDDDDDENVEAKLGETIADQEEPSFFDLISDEDDEEILELSRVYKKQSVSPAESNNETQNSLESNNCLENNDDCCFVMFRDELEKFAKSGNCIWKIRSLDKERVLIDFISKSLVVAIHLSANKELTVPQTIEDIKIVSLLSDSEDGDIAMVHDILLRKLDPEVLKLKHKTTQDILPLLDSISDKVKLLMDFMYELDKQRDFHLINRLGNRISFRLHSYKVQLVIKITVDIKLFEDVGPNDVTVECILGSIREKDIKQLINSVKKDHKFLTNYINDIKEYIALVIEE